MKSASKTRMLLGIASIMITSGALGVAEAGPPDIAGSFILPSQVQWQKVILPAGTYDFTMDLSGSVGRLAVRQGTKTVAIVVLQAKFDASTHDKSSMEIVDYQVRTLHLAPLGVTYIFPGHRGERERLEAGGRALRAAVVPVSVK